MAEEMKIDSGFDSIFKGKKLFRKIICTLMDNNNDRIDSNTVNEANNTMNEANNTMNENNNTVVNESNTINENNTVNEMDDNVLKQILYTLEKEDHLKTFTGDIHPNIYDAVSPIVNSDEPKEIERTLKHYFEQVIQVTQNNSKLNMEAKRMLQVLDRIFKDGTVETQPVRDLTDEIVDFYLISLKHFASQVNEGILDEHIEYLDRQQ